MLPIIEHRGRRVYHEPCEVAPHRPRGYARSDGSRSEVLLCVHDSRCCCSRSRGAGRPTRPSQRWSRSRRRLSPLKNPQAKSTTYFEGLGGQITWNDEVVVEVSASGPGIQNPDLVRLQACKRGRATLGGRGVTDDGLEHLAPLASLEVLVLSGSGVTDAGLKHLAALRAWRTLDPSDTAVTDWTEGAHPPQAPDHARPRPHEGRGRGAGGARGPPAPVAGPHRHVDHRRGPRAPRDGADADATRPERAPPSRVRLEAPAPLTKLEALNLSATAVSDTSMKELAGSSG